MTREEAKKEIEKVFEPAFANYIIMALEPKPMEKFKSVKDHIFKLAGDYKCWDNRLTDDEALELCHILEQEPILDKVKQARKEIKNEVKFWSDSSKYNEESLAYVRKAKARSYKHCLEILDKLIESEDNA